MEKEVTDEIITDNKKIYKYILLAVFFCVILISFFLYLYHNNNVTPKSKASEMADRVYHICPTGTAGQNDCDYIGGDGIQQAIHDHTTLPILSVTPAAPTPVTGQYHIRISLKPGTYTPAAGIWSEGKNIILSSNPPNQATIAAGFSEAILRITDNSQAVVQDLNIVKTGTNPLKAGINIKDTAKVLVQHVDISGNQYGIEVEGSANAIVSASNIHNNAIGIRDISAAQVVVHNNLIINNSQYGVFHSPVSTSIHTLDLANNTFFNNGTQSTDAQVELGAYSNFNMVNTIIGSGPGLGIHRPADTGANHFQGHLYLSHNDVYQHILHNGMVSNYVAGDIYLALPDVAHWQLNAAAANLDGNKSIVATFGTGYRLMSGSPLTHAGASTIKNPDSSVSDMGAYGGPDACDLDMAVNGCIISPTGTPSVTPTNTPTPTPSH